MVIHKANGRRTGRIALIAVSGLMLAAAFAGAQSAERNTDARSDAATRRTGTAFGPTVRRHEEHREKAKLSKQNTLVTPKKKAPPNPN